MTDHATQTQSPRAAKLILAVFFVLLCSVPAIQAAMQWAEQGWGWPRALGVFSQAADAVTNGGGKTFTEKVFPANAALRDALQTYEKELEGFLRTM